MAAIFWGLLLIAVGLFHLRELRNKNSWWIWTNWQARGYRDYFGDDGYERFMRISNTILIGIGVFFILDTLIGTQIMINWIESKSSRA